MAIVILQIAAALMLAVSLNCCSCINRNDTGTTQIQKEASKEAAGNLPERSLPPGQADIEAWMQDFREVEDGFLCKVKISQVNGYGPATPPLPQGYVITLDVPGSLLEKNRYEAGKIFVRGKLLALSIRYQKAPLNKTASGRWIATGFRNLRQ